MTRRRILLSDSHPFAEPPEPLVISDLDIRPGRERFRGPDFRRYVEMTPAFDKRNSDPNKNYGIGSVDLRMILAGPLGATQFVLYTAWYPTHVVKETYERLLRKREILEEIDLRCSFRPLPADLGYHSPKPLHESDRIAGSEHVSFADGEDMDVGEGQTIRIPKITETGTFDPCPYLGGGPCYYDGSVYNAERVYERLLNEGDDGVWQELEDYYVQLFEP